MTANRAVMGRAVVVVAVIAAAALLSAARAPVARADGCGPGLLGSATRWKDRNAIFDFARVCDWHDRCYGSRGYGWDPVRSPGSASVPYPREWCDSGFLHGMKASCASRRTGAPVAALCRAVASAFYGLVRQFGGPWYRRADGHRTLARLVWPTTGPSRARAAGSEGDQVHRRAASPRMRITT